MPAATKRPSWMLSTCVAVPDDRRAQHGVVESRAAPGRAPPWPAYRPGIARSADRDRRATGSASCRAAGRRTAACNCAVTTAASGSVEIGLRSGLRADQLGLALDVALLEVDVLLREFDQLCSATCRLLFSLAKSVRAVSSLAFACASASAEGSRSIANSSSPD